MPTSSTVTSKMCIRDRLITTDAKLQKANPKKYALGISDHYGKMEEIGRASCRERV